MNTTPQPSLDSSAPAPLAQTVQRLSLQRGQENTAAAAGAEKDAAIELLRQEQRLAARRFLYRLASVPAYAIVLCALGFSVYFHCKKAQLAEQLLHLHEEEAAWDAMLGQAAAAERKAADAANDTEQMTAELNATEKRMEALREAPDRETAQQAEEEELRRAEAALLALRAEVASKERLLQTSAKKSSAGAPIGRAPASRREEILVKLANGMMAAVMQGKKNLLLIMLNDEVRLPGLAKKKLSKAAAADVLASHWEKYTERHCEMTGLGLGKNSVEILYDFRYTDKNNQTVCGHAKQTWQVNAESCRIIEYQEECSMTEPFELSSRVQAVNPAPKS